MGGKMDVQGKRLPQPMLPRGFAGRITAWLMVRGHRSIYENMAKALDLQDEDDLLEVACGCGHFIRKYASHVRSVAGVDLSELMVRQATKKNKGRIAAGTAEFVQGEASQLPWEDGRFSAVACMGSFYGFPKPLESLKEMHRVLKKGGRAVISIDWHAGDGQDHTKKVEGWGMWLWTEDDVRTMMEEAAFSDVTAVYGRGFTMPKMMIVHGVKR